MSEKKKESTSESLDVMDERMQTEIRGLFDDVPDAASLDEEDVFRRISEYLEENEIEFNNSGDSGVAPTDAFDDVIILTDEDGNELQYTEVATINMEGRTFVLLQSLDDCLKSITEGSDAETDVYVFEEITDANGEKLFEAVEDDNLLEDIVKNYEVMLNEYYNSQNESNAQ
ncbi:MAG: DUF1292 domain-containing protein [Clostridia bacterium]|nr:DUF1292 domain-containing protein [Clostridia bacterium]